MAIGQIRRLCKGHFYKPHITDYGELLPDIFEIIKDLIEKDEKQIGYITGHTVFNELKLTTQAHSILQIGTTKMKKTIKRGNYQIHFIQQKNVITKDNIKILQLLDCLRLFKIIRDTTPNQVCKQLLHVLMELDDKQKSEIKILAIKYMP